MKIIKRNGTEVAFDISKIVMAISKANIEVDEKVRLTPVQIDRIAESVEVACEEMGRSPSVEEIQDLVEKAIMSHGAFEVAKEYITYRYTRNLLRQSNTTDDRILSLIECNNEEVKQENANKNPTINAVQRDYMAGEVSKDITSRILLPRDIVAAHEAGIIHFHDSDYYAQHMHNCDLINLDDMLQNGTVISGTLIEKPHSFSTACNIATQIIAQVASNQYGGQSISLTHLAPFVQISREKIRRSVEKEMKTFGVAPSEEAISQVVEERLRDEVRRGVQTIQYQVVTLMTTNGQAPFITVFMYLNEARNEQEKKDLAMIIEETLRQRYEGVKNEKGVWITPCLPQADLCSGGGKRPGGDTLLVPDQAGCRMHRQADGSRLYQRKEDAGVQALQGRDSGQRRCVHLHGLPQLPDAGPVRQRLGQHCRGQELRTGKAQVLWPIQPGRGHRESGGCSPVLREGYGQVLADIR